MKLLITSKSAQRPVRVRTLVMLKQRLMRGREVKIMVIVTLHLKASMRRR